MRGIGRLRASFYMPAMTTIPRPHNPPAALLVLIPHALAVLWLGLMAGFFGTYSANVNLAMLQMDGATYATVQSAFNRNVRHALFFALFFGPRCGARWPWPRPGVNTARCGGACWPWSARPTCWASCSSPSRSTCP